MRTCGSVIRFLVGPKHVTLRQCETVVVDPPNNPANQRRRQTVQKPCEHIQFDSLPM